MTNTDHTRAGLEGPSRTIIVEPAHQPQETPVAPDREPAAPEPGPARETEPVPA